MPARLARKVLLIGWDAADWKVIKPLMDEGQMPLLEQLVERGVMADLATLRPQFSPMLWTSIATGKRPFKHGVLGFTEPTPDGRAVQPVTNLSRKTKAVWNVLNQKGLKSNVVGWWPSHPAEPISGVMVSDFFQKANAPLDKEWKMRPGAVHPPELTDTLADLRVHPQELDAEHILPFVPEAGRIDQNKDKRLSSVAKVLAECSSIHSVATHLIQDQPWDFMAVYHDAIDHFCHGFMRYHPPKQEHVKKEDFDLYKDVVVGGYRYHDMMLGSMMHWAGPDTTVILISDHGFHPDHLRPKSIPAEPAGPAAEHRDWGILVMAGPGIKQDELIHGATLLDICPTILTLFGLPVGEDMDGKPLTEAFVKAPNVDTIPSWDEVEGDAGLHPPDRKLEPFESKEALDQLVDLGYVDKLDENVEKAVANSVQELRYNLSRAYMDADRHAEAAPLLAELYENEPSEHRFGVQLAMCYRALERTAELRTLVEAIRVRLKKDSIEARKKLIEWRDEIEKRKAAMEDGEGEEEDLLKREEQFEIRKLRGLAAPSPFALDYLEGFALAAEGRADEALKALERAEKADPDRPGLHIQIGEAYLKLKRWPDAERAFQHAYHIDADNPHAHLGMARALLAQRKNRLASGEALKAVGALYHYPLAHFCLGVALHRVGRIKRAVEALEVAVSLNPNFPEAHRRLSHIYQQRLRDHEMAAKHRELARTQRKTNMHQETAPTAPPTDLEPAAVESQPAGPAERITIVSGLPRSGTSLMMSMLQAAGLPLLTDETRAADEDNPRGYFELDAVKRTRKDNKWVEDAAGKAVKVIHLLLYDLPPDRSYDIIIMRRDMREVVASQRKMLKRRSAPGAKLSDQQLRHALERQLIQVTAYLNRNKNFRVLAVDYNDLLEKPAEQSARVLAFVESEESPETVSAVIDQSLWRNRAPGQVSPDQRSG